MAAKLVKGKRSSPEFLEPRYVVFDVGVGSHEAVQLDGFALLVVNNVFSNVSNALGGR